MNALATGGYGTKIWLMGDGSLDNITNITSIVSPSIADTHLNLVNMNSNDLVDSGLEIGPIDGFTYRHESTELVANDTLGDETVVCYNITLTEARRFVIRELYVETHILPFLSVSGRNYYIGLLNSGADLTAVTDADFMYAFKWTRPDLTSFYTVKVLVNGVENSTNSFPISDGL